MGRYLASLGAFVLREAPSTGDPAIGAVVYREVCAQCHGAKAKGNPETGVPPLRHFQNWYLVDQVRAFKEMTRQGDPEGKESTHMHSIVYKTISISDAEDSAAYLAREFGFRAPTPHL